MTHKEYINKFGSQIISAVRGSTLFPSVMMAQALLESADAGNNPGSSKAAKIGCNHFGLQRDDGWLGETLTIHSVVTIAGERKEIITEYKVYSSTKRGFKNRVALLLNDTLYKKSGVFFAKTADLQAKAFQTVGYSREVGYADKLIAMMKEYNLYELDDLEEKSMAAVLICMQ